MRLRPAVLALLALALAVPAAAGAAAPPRLPVDSSVDPGPGAHQLVAGFGAKAITPVGTPPAEWAQYFTPHPETGVWGEPYSDLNGDGCMSGLTNEDVGPVTSGRPPTGEAPEPHVDQPWNSAGDGYETGAPVWQVRGVQVVGDPDSTGKWDGVWANAGFGAKCALGKHDDTWARAVLVETGDTTVAMVSLDVVGLFNIEVQRMRTEMKRRYPQMQVDELVVSSTHTHEGVDTMGYWGQLFAGTDGKFPAYQAFIRSQVIDAVHQAWAGREEARVAFGSAVPEVAIRDSRPPVVKDPAVEVARFTRPDGTPLGTAVLWSNHPEAQGSNNPLVSSDYAHGARVEIEERLGGTAVFFSGAVGGLQTPLGVDVPGFGSTPSWERTYRIGELIADAAVAAVADAEPVPVSAVQAVRREFYLDSDNTALRALNAKGVFDIPTFVGGDSYGRDRSAWTDGVRTEEAGDQVRTEMVGVQLLGPSGRQQAVFLTVPGELSPEIELGGYGRPECPSADTGRPHEPVIRDAFSAEHVFVLGLGQDELGYIIPGYDFHLGPQEADGGPVPVGGVQARHCGEGHYEETVSISSVFAPWVACVAAELGGGDPWTTQPACSRENTSLMPYGIKPGAALAPGLPLHEGHLPPGWAEMTYEDVLEVLRSSAGDHGHEH